MKLKIKKIKVGILGGSFDPAHKGHLTISKEALKKFNLKSVIWAITNKNPFKKKSINDLKKRIVTSMFLVSILVLAFMYTYILIVSLIVISLISFSTKASN